MSQPGGLSPVQIRPTGYADDARNEKSREDAPGGFGLAARGRSGPSGSPPEVPGRDRIGSESRTEPPVAPVRPSGREPRISEGLSLRVLLLLGFAGIFLLWMLSAYSLVRRMIETDQRGGAIRSRFLQNEELLSTVRAQTLLSSVYLRDALLDTGMPDVTPYQDQLLVIREEVEQALASYVPRTDEPAEREPLQELESELQDYWDSMIPVLLMDRTPSPALARTVLREDIIPKRETIIRISDRIHTLNRNAFDQEQREVAGLRQDLRRRVWQTSTVAVLLGIGIAIVATRYAGRLETRIREQHAHERRHLDELERLSSQLMQAQEIERRRIARELHDEVGQALSAIKLELSIVERDATTTAAVSSLGEARAITDGALQTVRDLSQLLHPAMLDDLGLPETADWYLKGFSRRTGITSELVIDRLDSRLPPDLEVCTYRVMQEAVTNVARHADATACRVAITRTDRALQMTIEDDGKGFDPAQSRAPLDRGLGLVSIRERVARLGGQLQVDSRKGIGTRLMVELPLAEA